MINFEVFQLVALFVASVSLGQPCAVIGKSEKISLTKEAHRVDRPHYICINKLVRLLGMFLRFTIVYYGYFGFITTVTNIVFRIINKQNFKAT